MNLPSPIRSRFPAAPGLRALGLATTLALTLGILAFPAPAASTPDTAATPAAAPAATTSAAQGSETNSAGRLDFPAFRIVAERNIFNTTRSARGAGGGPGGRDRARETRRAPKVESVSLVGTIAYEKGRFAFFEGSSAEFRKVLQKGNTIAGHTIDDIGQNGIRLKQGDKIVELKVSQHLRREDDGDWQLSETAAPPAAASAASSSGSGTNPASSSTTSSDSPDSGEVSDVLKRLMQQREKELK